MNKHHKYITTFFLTANQNPRFVLALGRSQAYRKYAYIVSVNVFLKSALLFDRRGMYAMISDFEGKPV